MGGVGAFIEGGVGRLRCLRRGRGTWTVQGEGLP
jgi:hypothetical protein